MDLSSKDGRQYYKAAKESLFDDKAKFDVEPNNFQMFINLLDSRVRDLGMLEPNMNLMIPPDPANPALGIQINSIKDYG